MADHACRGTRNAERGTGGKAWISGISWVTSLRLPPVVSGDCRERDAVRLDDQVVLAAGPVPVHRGRDGPVTRPTLPRADVAGVDRCGGEVQQVCGPQLGEQQLVQVLSDPASFQSRSCLEKALVDRGFKDVVIIHGAVNDITIEVVRRNPDGQGKGFVPQLIRWRVEQVNSTLMLHRRPAREYDTGPTTRPRASTGSPPPACSTGAPPPPRPGGTSSRGPREHHRTPGPPA